MNNKTTVIVKYVGHEDFRDSVPESQSLQAVKVHALQEFGIEPSAADKYALQFNGTDVNEKEKVGTFGKDNVIFTLTLKQEVPKGVYVRA